MAVCVGSVNDRFEDRERKRERRRRSEFRERVAGDKVAAFDIEDLPDDVGHEEGAENVSNYAGIVFCLYILRGEFCLLESERHELREDLRHVAIEADWRVDRAELELRVADDLLGILHRIVFRRAELHRLRLRAEIGRAAVDLLGQVEEREKPFIYFLDSLPCR